MKPIDPKKLGKDIPIEELIPFKKRTVSNRAMNRLRASINVEGVIEPLIVYRNEEGYLILDGYLRYTILKELGCQTVPCIIIDTPDLLSPDKFVCHISPAAESQMLRKATEHLSEAEIATALGIKVIGHRLSAFLISQLHPSIASAFDSGQIGKSFAKEISQVLPKRQVAIFKKMEELGNFGMGLLKQLILSTPKNEQRNIKGKSPWKKNDERKTGIVQRMKIADKAKDFCSKRFHDMTSDLVRCVAYARQILEVPDIYEYLCEHFPEQLNIIQEILHEELGSRVNHKPKKNRRNSSNNSRKAS